MFIQNLDEGLLLFDPYGVRIKYNNTSNTQVRTLLDKILKAISDYKENKMIT